MNDSLNYNYWRSGRDSNPRPPPWQGGILTSWTTRPVIYLNGGSGRNRTTDTRIFSPLLYRLSYLGKRNELFAAGGPSGTRTPDQSVMSRPLWPTELKAQFLVTPRGIEPLLPPWKGDVLTAWPRRRKANNSMFSQTLHSCKIPANAFALCGRTIFDCFVIIPKRYRLVNHFFIDFVQNRNKDYIQYFRYKNAESCPLFLHFVQSLYLRWVPLDPNR